jgi:hypothetical protein
VAGTSGPVPEMPISAQGPRSPRQAFAAPERRRLIEAMIAQRLRTGRTWDHVAAEHHVSPRTAERWRASDEWRQVEARWRRLLRDEVRTQITAVAGQAVDILVQLMVDPETPPFTRFHCAKALLEFAGIADELEERPVDQHDELIDFLRKQHQARAGRATILDVAPLDSGLLPPQMSERTAALTAARLADPAALPPTTESASRP